MGVGVWKLHHPCFFVFSCSARDDVGFQLPGGSFYPFGSGGISFGLPDDFYVFRLSGIFRSSRHVPASNTGRYRKENCTTDIELRVAA